MSTTNANLGDPVPRRTFLRRAALLGTGTSLANPLIAAALGPAEGWATTGENQGPITVSSFMKADGHAQYGEAIRDAIAHAVQQDILIVDFEGVSYITSDTIIISNPGVILQNGGIRPNGQFPALSVQADDVTVRNMTFSRSRESGVLATTPERSCVLVTGRRFRSIDCQFLGAGGSCVYLTNGRCDGTIIQGGQMTTGSAKQDSSGVYAANGSLGNRNLIIDGVQIHGAATGISLFDSSDCVVKNCQVQDIQALPVIYLRNWTHAGGNVWRIRSAAGTPNVDGVRSDREDGSTNVVTVDGTQLGGVYQGSQPDAYTATQADGYLYINLDGENPNDKNITSGIVSGYAYMLYTSEGTCDRNTFSNCHAKNCDGFGIYFQLGRNGYGNQAIRNTLEDVCKAGLQHHSLPFAAIGVAGGSGTALHYNTINGTGSIRGGTPGIHVTPSALNPTDGELVGNSVSKAAQHGYYISSSNWLIKSCRADRNSGNGFLVTTIAKDAMITGVRILDSESHDNQGAGFCVDGGNSDIGHISVSISGGSSSENFLSGLAFIGSEGFTVRDSSVSGMRLQNNDMSHTGKGQIWIRSGCLRTNVENCYMSSTVPDSEGLVIDPDAQDTVITGNLFVIESE